MRYPPTPDHVVLVSFHDSAEVIEEAHRVIPQLYGLTMWMPPKARAKVYRNSNGNWELAVPYEFTVGPVVKIEAPLTSKTHEADRDWLISRP